MNSFGERLKEERIRLGLNQEDFGAIGGVQKLAQRNYEKNNREPGSSYMTALASAGVNVMYLLTGEQSGVVHAVGVDKKILQGSLEIAFNVIERIKKKTGGGVRPARAAELVLMIYECLDSDEEFGDSEIELLMKFAS